MVRIEEMTNIPFVMVSELHVGAKWHHLIITFYLGMPDLLVYTMSNFLGLFSEPVSCLDSQVKAPIFTTKFFCDLAGTKSFKVQVLLKKGF